MEEKKADEISQNTNDIKSHPDNLIKPVHTSKPNTHFAKAFSKRKQELTDKIRENPWVASTAVLAILVFALFLTSPQFTGNMITGSVVSEEIAGEKLLAFANDKGANAELVKVSENENFYEVVLSIEGNELPLYVTKDGKYFAQGLVPLAISDNPKNEPTPTEITKSDNPKAELFVMTHCPFGTQAEKGFIPAIESLNNIADVKIRFVHYYMHTNNQEEVETPRQVCIREEQSDKFLDYLKCFLGGTSGSVSEANACAKKVGIDERKLKDCIESGRAEDYYAEDSKLSEEYGVRGSPTLVINGVIVNTARDSESYFNTVCSAFNNIPEICINTELDSTSPSPGFGYETSGTGSTASCG